VTGGVGRQRILGLLAVASLLSGFTQVPDSGVAGDPVAQDPGAVLESFLEQERAREGAAAEGQAPRPELPAAGMLESLAAFDSASAQAYLAALRGLYDYQARGFEHRSRVFAWQFYSSLMIFAIVHLIVLMGLYFSWMQFRQGWATGLESEMELSTTGIKIRSSVLGVIILTLSLAFFYLYLVYIYPIREIF
jgi:hypothetical protein